MTDKIYRLHLSDILDRDVIRFLDSVKSTRRAELSRYMLRYYMSHMESNTPTFLPIQEVTANELQGKEVLKEFKLRLDTTLDTDIIQVMEQVPRRRRSEFVRHVFHFYLSHLPQNTYILMPFASTEKEEEPEEEEQFVDTEELPGDELSGFDF